MSWRILSKLQESAIAKADAPKSLVTHVGVAAATDQPGQPVLLWTIEVTDAEGRWGGRNSGHQSKGDRKMPHVLVKLYSGRSEQQKTKLAAAVAKAVVTTLKCGDDAVSVAIEDVNPQAWTAEVYKTDILNNPNIYKKPGYDPSE